MGELHCPYCNAVVPLLPVVRPGQPITCPRCEETFKARVSAEAQALPPAAHLAPPPPPVQTPARSNLTVALGVLGLMAVMALAALTLALWTRAERRTNDAGLKRSRLSHKRRPQRDADVSPPETVEPVELGALGYLPADSDVLAAAHVAEALRASGGRQRLEQTFPVLGSVGVYLKRLETLTGLRLEDIEHIVAGAQVNSSQGLPRLIVVVRTRQAFDAGAVRSALKARESPLARGRPLFMFQQELLPAYSPGFVSFPNERTLVLGWQVAKNLSAMPTQKRPGDEKLPDAITSMLAGRGKPAGPVWVAGHSDNWPGALALPLALRLLKLDAQERNALAKVRTFSAWLEMHDRATLRVVIRCADAVGAELLERSLRGRLQGEKGLVVVQKDEWLDLQYRLPK